MGTAEGDGVSMVSRAFATGLANGGANRILLIQADFRGTRPAPHVAGGGETLADLLQGDRTALEAILHKAGPLVTLPPGETLTDPLALLQNGETGRLLGVLRQNFDHIILDCPPPLQCPESLVMAREADGLVLVVRAGATRKSVARRSLQMITQSGARPLGTVINRRRHYIPNWLYRLL
jgi:Mrp family chromosome partitioning ATPase